MTLDNMTGITKGSYTGVDLFCKSQLITCNRVKECNGVCPFEDALKHADKEMNEQTVIDHDRDWIIGCIEHDGFIHTHRFDKANQIILEALEAPSGDLISRADAMRQCKNAENELTDEAEKKGVRVARFIIGELPSADRPTKCIAEIKIDNDDLIKRIKEEYELADRPHGEWEHWGSPFSDESEVIDTIVCSVCGERFIEPKDEPKGEYNYCPNCGARMGKVK